MIISGKHRSPDAPKPASLNNAGALRMQLRKAGHELRLDADGQLVIDPPDADVLAGAQPWLQRYYWPLVALVRFDALHRSAPGESDEQYDGVAR